MKMGNNNNEERYQWNNLQNVDQSEFKPALKYLKNIIDLDVNAPFFEMQNLYSSEIYPSLKLLQKVHF